MDLGRAGSAAAIPSEWTRHRQVEFIAIGYTAKVTKRLSLSQRPGNGCKRVELLAVRLPEAAEETADRPACHLSHRSLSDASSVRASQTLNFPQGRKVSRRLPP